MSDLQDDIKPAAFTAASTAVMGTVGGLLPALVHTLTSAGDPFTAAWLLTTDVAVVAAIGLGQGVAAGATALARGRGAYYISPRRGFVAALAVGVFNGLMYFTQMAVPVTELGWIPDLIIMMGVGVAAGWSTVRMPAQEPVLTV